MLFAWTEQPPCSREGPIILAVWLQQNTVNMNNLTQKSLLNTEKNQIELFSIGQIIFIVQVIKSRRMRWAGHVARMGEERGSVWGLGGETGGKETTGDT